MFGLVFHVTTNAFCELEYMFALFQMGEDQSAKSMVLEIKWLDDYPDVIPEINLNAFYNKHL